jgi:acyl carrier protein
LKNRLASGPAVKHPEFLAALTLIFRENLGDDNLALTMTAKTRDVPGFDSAKMVLLILAVEERFGIQLRSREIDSLRSIRNWVEVIEAARARS